MHDLSGWLSFMLILYKKRLTNYEYDFKCMYSDQHIQHIEM